MNEATIRLNENEPPPDSLLLLWQGLIDEIVNERVEPDDREEASQEAMCAVLKTWQNFPAIDATSEETTLLYRNNVISALIRMFYEEERQGKLNGQNITW